MIGMSLGHTHRVHQTLRVTQSLRMTTQSRMLLQGHLFALRMSLIRELREEQYEPKANCPECRREMTPIEIIRGFNQNPADFTTQCSACGHRFQPQLICFAGGVRLELPFFCDTQTLAQLPGKQALPPEQLALQWPAIYRAAIVHHGGIRQAFAKVGLDYPFEEISDWRIKIRGFLGRMPDKQIAECVDVSVNVIRAIRKKLGVARYTARIAVAEAGLSE